MNKAQALGILRTYKDNHAKEYGITKLGVFGSVARDESSLQSDIDVVVELESPNLFLLSRIRMELEELFRSHVDIVRMRDKMNAFLKQQIHQDALYV